MRSIFKSNKKNLIKKFKKDPTLFGGTSNRFNNPSNQSASLGTAPTVAGYTNSYPYNQSMYSLAGGGGGGGGGGGTAGGGGGGGIGSSSSLHLQNQAHNNMTRSVTSSAYTNGNGSPNLRIQYERLAFYDYLYEISSPVRMFGTLPNQRPLTFWFNFFLNTEQVNQILETR